MPSLLCHSYYYTDPATTTAIAHRVMRPAPNARCYSALYYDKTRYDAARRRCVCFLYIPRHLPLPHTTPHFCGVSAITAALPLPQAPRHRAAGSDYTASRVDKHINAYTRTCLLLPCAVIVRFCNMRAFCAPLQPVLPTPLPAIAGFFRTACTHLLLVVGPWLLPHS